VKIPSHERPKIGGIREDARETASGALAGGGASSYKETGACIQAGKILKLGGARGNVAAGKDKVAYAELHISLREKKKKKACRARKSSRKLSLTLLAFRIEGQKT